MPTSDVNAAADPQRAARLKARVAELEREIDAAAAGTPRMSARAQARRRSEGVDRIIADVLSEAATDVAKGGQRELPGAGRGRVSATIDLAVVGVGGYGRSELSPRSDVDLVFLLPGKASKTADSAAPEKRLIERVLYALWDSGLEIGHAVRTVSECVEVGKKEVTARSSMLDHRFVAGDRDLYATFASTLERRLFRVDPAAFVGAKLLEIVKRRERWGAAVSRNEPNLKEGEGGLRDAHTALWIARTVWGIADAQGLVARGMARPGDVAEFDAAFERLLEVRSMLHKVAGRKEDRLSFERQDVVAKSLGYEDSRRGSGTELFMQSLTQSMAAVQRFLQLIVDRMPDRFHMRAEKIGAGGLTQRPRGGGESKARAPKGFRVRRGRLLFADPDVAKHAPVELVRIFAVGASRRLPLHPEARDVVRRERDRIADVRAQTPAIDAFWELLLHHDPDAVEKTLLEMNDLGALGALLPEFDALYYRVQHDTYHVYTSDAHLIVAVANLHRLRAGRWEEQEPLLTKLSRELPLRTLGLGVFLHDVGKSERGHTEAGLRMLPSLAKQLRLSEPERATVHFLIEQHLLMSHVSQRRDLSDPKTISDFAGKMGQAGDPQALERLKLLYTLTFCDIQAVGPGAWTDWKGALLRELYLKAETALVGGVEAVGDQAAARAAATKAEALARVGKDRLADHSLRGPLEEFLAVLPQRYFATSDADAVIDDFALSRVDGKAGLKVQARVLPERRVTEVTFQALDRPGLFADFTGALAAAGLSIRTARIHTVPTTPPIAIDRFEVAGSDGGVVDLLALDRMVRDLLWVMTGKQTAAELLSRRRPPSYGISRAPGKPPRVDVHNDASAEATVVDVFARDRLGVLHDIASALTRLGLDIHVAIVSTKVDQVADSFYVRTVGGGKLTDPSKLEALRAELLSRVD